MSLESPTFLEKLIANKPMMIGIACLAALLVLAWIFASVGDWTFNRGVNKQQAEVNAKVEKIANLQANIAELEREKAKTQGELNRDMEELQRNIYGLDDAKAESNRALANFNTAVNSNSNVNVTAEDLKRVVERLEK